MLAGFPDVQKGTILGAHFDDHGLAQTRMRHCVQQHDPPILGTSLPAPRTRHVHDLVAAEAPLLRDLQRALARFDREDAPLRTRGIFGAAEDEEERGADEHPPRIEPPKHAAIIRAVTREEIEEKLVAIIRQEKNIPDEMLKPDTPLADAGIDSLDSLTILFGIEESFGISIPDDRARAIKTLGDMTDVVVDLTSK